MYLLQPSLLQSFIVCSVLRYVLQCPDLPICNNNNILSFFRQAHLITNGDWYKTSVLVSQDDLPNPKLIGSHPTFINYLPPKRQDITPFVSILQCAIQTHTLPFYMDFMRHGEDNRGKCADNPAGCHPIWTINAPIFIITPILHRMSFLHNLPPQFILAWDRH